MPQARRTRRATVLAALATVTAILLGTTDTLSGFTTATVTNSANDVRSGLLAVSHAYNSTTCSATLQQTAAVTPCNGSLYPATSTGTAVSDTVTNTGTVSATSTYQVAACGAVSFANSGSTSTYGAMLARNGTTFSTTPGPLSGTTAATFDGTKGYASSTTAVAAPTYPSSFLTSVTTRVGKGIWFKTTSATVQPLFSLSTAGNDDVNATTDRVLFLNAAGQISFMATALGAATPASATSYKDGNWHYAYVLITAVRAALNGASTYTASVSVDGGATVSSGTNTTLGTLAPTNGYWHVGWGEIVAGNGYYFNGSLAGFTVDDSGSSVAPTTTPTAYPAGEQQWKLSDSGGAYDGTTTTGISTAAPFGASDPCTSVSATWPYAGVNTATTLRTLAGVAKTATFPAPGATLPSTITLTSTAAAVLKGLILYAPIRADYTVGSSSWTVTQTWSAAPGSTVVVA